jgi:hypothetical protein
MLVDSTQREVTRFIIKLDVTNGLDIADALMILSEKINDEPKIIGLARMMVDREDNIIGSWMMS